MNQLIIREAPLEELPRIAGLKKQIHDLHVSGRPDLFGPIEDPSAFAAHAAQEGVQLLLAEISGQVVGYVLFRYMERPANLHAKERRFTHVQEFCVGKAFRHMGTGRALMDALKSRARTKGYPRIELDVWSFNEGARQFYEAMGFSTFRYYMEMNADESDS